MKRVLGLLLLLCLVALLSACARGKATVMQDGYYTAEAAEFDDYGWKEYLTIYISNDKIVTVEYNAYNASGFIKSWDMDYMRTMNAISGTYPNKYAREYAADLLNKQNPAQVDCITGATSSYNTFRQLAAAVIERAENGDHSVAFVTIVNG